MPLYTNGLFQISVGRPSSIIDSSNHINTISSIIIVLYVYKYNNNIDKE